MKFTDLFSAATRVFQPPHVRTNFQEVQQAFLTGRPDPTTGGFARPPFSNHSISYSCMVIVAQAMAAVPYKLFKKKSDKSGNPIPVIDHPLLALMNDPFPGIYGDFTQFIETIALYLEATGNAFILADAIDTKGIPRSLMVLGLQHVRPLIDQNSGRLTGWKVSIGRTETLLGPLDLIHMKYTNPESMTQVLGIGPLQAAMHAINTDLARQTYDAAFFTNGARLSLALTYRPPDTRPEDQFLTQEQVYQVRESFYDSYAGATNAGKIAVVHGGFQLQELGMSQKDMDFVEGRKWSRQEIAAVFRIPAPLLNDFQHAGLGREGVSVAQRMLYENNIAPKVHRLTSLFQKFLVDVYAPGHVGGFDLDALPAMRDDVNEKVSLATQYAAMGWPINQINKLLKLGFDPVPWGDDFLVQQGMVPARQLAGPEAFTMNFDGVLQDPSLIDTMENQKQIENSSDVATENTSKDTTDKASKDTASQDKTAKDTARSALLANYRFQLWQRFLSSFRNTELQYKKRLHRFVYDLRVEVKKNISAKMKTRSYIDDLLDGMMFDIDAAQKTIREFSRRYFEQAIMQGAKEVARLADAPVVGLESPVAQELLATKDIDVQNIPLTIADNLKSALRDALEQSFQSGETLSKQALRLQEATNEVFTFTANRARTIARTEILSAVNGGKQSEYKEQGIEEIEWLSAGDEVVRKTHQIDGETVRVGELFSNGLQFPCDPDSNDPAEVINCRCTTIPVITD